jgi:FAD/FMN-containing dehydrogenase
METLARLQKTLAAGVILAPEPSAVARHLKDFTEAEPASANVLGLAYPRSTADVSQILKICFEDGVPVTPQGGMTGLAGGGVPAVPSIVLSLERMRAIEELDPAAATITVQAGTVLETVQNAADEAGYLFPLDLGGRGSCQVGGNASTNAGGNRVLRFGMMRDLVLGVEAVLADGTVISALNKMIKNNAGYDLKHLFIGSEGTLGVITRLVLKLHPKPSSVATGLVAVKDYQGVVELLRRSRRGFGGTLSAFEAMWPEFYHLGTAALGRKPPIAPTHGLYVLMETMGNDPSADQMRFETVIAQAIADEVASDAVVAQSGRETRALWAIRDCPGEFRRVHWPQIGFDISVPTGAMGDFVAMCRAEIKRRWPETKPVFFGHVADSNLHISVKVDPDPSLEHDIEEFVYAAVGQCKGSISAEHGIGTKKREFLHYSRSPEEVALMRALKTALDPKGILNPGKVV